MTLAQGHTLAHYTILGPLGAGAMGEVYRAKDSKLGREVAIKVLPEHFASDEERLRRFEREAKSLASLNHPNVAQIFGVDQVGDTCFLVLELVPGESLEERLKRGPLSIDESLDVCKQIAEGLEAAHEAGVIHRDLKPANIRLTPDGKVKVLDFGLAKPANESGSGSSTDSVLSTEAGRLLGTPTYMAPEQARGKAIDRRVDIWAFGCVLFECLTAKRAFAGETLTDVLGAVLHTTPDLARLPADTPARVRELLGGCLVKDPRERARDIGEIRRQLDRARAEPAPEAPVARGRGGVWIAWGAAAFAVVAALFFALQRPPAAPDRPAYSFTLTQQGTGSGQPAISPDGRHLAFTSKGGIWLRDLAERESHLLEGTAQGDEPFWSPDSRQIGFFADRKLKRVGLSGAPPEALADVPDGVLAGTWGSQGTILIDVTESTEHEGWYTLPRGQSTLKQFRQFGRDRPVDPDKSFPCFLPDGRHFLFTHPSGQEAFLQLGDAETGECRALVPADSRPFYAEPGYVLYVRRGVLLAQAFDARALEMRGEPVQLIEAVESYAMTGMAYFTVSQEGTLVFRPPAPDRTLQWFDREGRALETLLKPDGYRDLDLSPDGKQLITAILDSKTGSPDLWLVDLQRGMPTRLTSARRGEYVPRWSPDGKQIAFGADWKGPPNVQVWDLASSAARELVPFDRKIQFPSDWASDGLQLFYWHQHEGTGADIWSVNIASGERHAIVATPFDELLPKLSPDGRYLAYESDDSGSSQVYIQSIADARDKLRVSLDGGRNPHWPRQGKELLFSKSSDTILSAEVSYTPDGRIQAAPPRQLFTVPGRFSDWTVTADGQRFLLVLRDPKTPLAPDEVVVGWPRLLTR